MQMIHKIGGGIAHKRPYLKIAFLGFGHLLHPNAPPFQDRVSLQSEFID